MKIYLATAGDFDWSHQCREKFRSFALQDRFCVHQLTDDPQKADIILFIDIHQHPGDWWLGAFHRHALTRKYPRKTFVYDERDHPWCLGAGVYVSVSKREFDPRFQRAGSYFALKNQLVEKVDSSSIQPDLLFSFLGALSHPVRRRVAALHHERAVVEDTSHLQFFVSPPGGSSPDDLKQQKEHYRDVLLRSRFVLCPRGEGTSSFRLFETLSLGRVPVIISDDWVAPDGPDWEACSLRVAEAQVEQIPRMLEELEASFEEMAGQAGAAWSQWFAPEVRFHRLIQTCVSLLDAGHAGPRPYPILRVPVLRYGARLLKERISSALTGK